MFRNLSLALAVSMALWPAGGFALSLGGMVTKSALNEQFQADIELVAADVDDLENLHVTLASPADFARASLDRSYLLSTLRFKLMQLKDGRSVIRVTTKEAVREPFLDFLVEVNWPKGRLVREFTALLDPPVTPSQPPAILAPVTARVTSTTPAEGAPRPIARAEPKLPPQSSAESYPGMTITGQYGPVMHGDTLWSISKGLRVAGAGTEQVAMALFRSNPEAFIGGNINRLKAGAVLGVPSPDDMLAQPLGEARADFFDEAKGIHRVMPMPQDRLRIALKPQEEQLEAGVSKRAARGGEVEQVRTDLMMVRETSESNRQETEDLRSRIRELESQLTDIRQLLKLKSDQLAQIQAGQSEGPADKPPLVPRTEEQASSTQMEAPIEDVSAPSPVAPRVAQGALSTPPMIAGPEIPSAAERSDVANIQEAVHKQEAPPAVPAQISQQLPEKAPLAKRISPQRILPDISFGSALDQILGNPTMLGYGGAMLLILLSLGWLLLRRRRGTEVEFPEESGLLVEGEGGTTTVEHKVPSMARGDVAKDTSFISDFSPSDIDALQEEETGEVDPAAEADVYIAYGRYQQAENLIKQALDKTPERPELKLKLLEIYFTTRNTAAFTSLAEEMDAAGIPGSAPQVWERACSMGQELLPSHPLFGEHLAPIRGAEGEMPVDQGPSSELDELENLDLDLDLDAGISEMPSELGEASVLDLSLRPKVPSAATPPAGKPTASTPLEQESEFSLNLDDFSSLENIDLGDLGLESEGSLMTKDTQGIDRLSSVSDTSSPLLGVTEEEEIPAISLEELDHLGIGAPAAKSTSAGQPKSERPETLDFGGDVETKLDLARAYLEMGDGEGAREILQEVLTEGNQAQQRTARDLLAQVG